MQETRVRRLTFWHRMKLVHDWPRTKSASMLARGACIAVYSYWPPLNVSSLRLRTHPAFDGLCYEEAQSPVYGEMCEDDPSRFEDADEKEDDLRTEVAEKALAESVLERGNEGWNAPGESSRVGGALGEDDDDARFGDADADEDGDKILEKDPDTALSDGNAKLASDKSSTESELGSEEGLLGDVDDDARFGDADEDVFEENIAGEETYEELPEGLSAGGAKLAAVEAEANGGNELCGRELVGEDWITQRAPAEDATAIAIVRG